MKKNYFLSTPGRIANNPALAPENPRIIDRNTFAWLTAIYSRWPRLKLYQKKNTKLYI